VMGDLVYTVCLPLKSVCVLVPEMPMDALVISALSCCNIIVTLVVSVECNDDADALVFMHFHFFIRILIARNLVGGRCEVF
jgi:hypothetical protein